MLPVKSNCSSHDRVIDYRELELEEVVDEDEPDPLSDDDEPLDGEDGAGTTSVLFRSMTVVWSDPPLVVPLGLDAVPGKTPSR